MENNRNHSPKDSDEDVIRRTGPLYLPTVSWERESSGRRIWAGKKDDPCFDNTDQIQSLQLLQFAFSW